MSELLKYLKEGRISNAVDHFIGEIRSIDDFNPEKYKSLIEELEAIKLKNDQFINDSATKNGRLEPVMFAMNVGTLSALIIEWNKNKEPKNQGFEPIDRTDAIKEATDKVKTAKYMKIIGSGRQHHIENTNSNEIRDYYQAIENRLSSSSNSGRSFSVQRVTQHQLKNKFREHLRKCLSITEEQENKSLYSIVLYGNLMITNTFYILKDEEEGKSIIFLTHNIDNEEPFTNVDNVLVFKSEDQDIISTYEKYFDQFWEKEGKHGRSVSSLSEFEKYVPFNEQLYKKYNEIKNFIKRVPNESVRMQHLEYEINKIHERLRGLNNCNLRYP